MIENEIADEITSLGKTNKEWKKEDEREEIYITPENIQEIIDELSIVFHDQSGSAKDRCKPCKQIKFKTSMLRSDLCDFRDAYIVVKGDITLKKVADREFIDVRSRFLAFKNNAHLPIAYQRPIMY